MDRQGGCVCFQGTPTRVLRTISWPELDRILDEAARRAAFDEVPARYDATLAAFDRRSVDATVQEGALHLAQGLKAPACFTLAVGDLGVDGTVDLRAAMTGRRARRDRRGPPDLQMREDAIP